MLKNVKESAINDERLAISEERLATVFFTTDYTDYTVFLKKLLHILHSMATRSFRTMADGLHGFLPHAKAQRVAKKI